MHVRNVSITLLTLFLGMVLVPISYGQAVASTPAKSGSNAGSTDQATTTAAPSPQASADASLKAQAAIAAAVSVEQAITSSGSLPLTAERYQKVVSDITGATARRPQAAIEDLRTLQATVMAIQQSDILNALAKAKSTLDAGVSSSQVGVLKSRCDALPQTTPPQPDVADAAKACAQAQVDDAELFQALGDQSTSLTSALQSIYPYVTNQITPYVTKLDPLVSLSVTADASELLQKLPSGIKSLRELMASQQEYQATWNSIKPVLTQLKITAPAPAPSGDPVEILKTKINQILPKFHSWFAAVSTSLQSSSYSLNGMLTGVTADPARNNAAALDAVRSRADDLTSAQSIADSWPPLVGFLTDGDPTDFKLATTKREFDLLQRATNALRAASARLSDATAGDASNFESSQVSLFYFSDVPRLMQALNSNVRTIGGVAEAQQIATDQRKALAQAELDLADAQATVNKFQKQVLDLQEQQRQLREKLKGFNSNVSKLSNRLQNAQDAKNQADAGVGAAQSDPAAATSGALDRAKTKQTAAAGKLSQSQSDFDAAKAERDNVQGQLDGSQNQSDSLPAKLAAAQQALSDSQTAVSQERRRMILAAQAESDAFAFARDNAPFYFAQADGASTDPARRVYLYAFNDTKTIFMRGKPSDLDEVKHIIAEFDKPAPQARLTLWTFELSADSGQKANKKAAGKLNDAMDIVDQELGDTRAVENTVLTLLRDLINESVRYYASLTTPTPPVCQCSGADLEKLHRLNFYDPNVLGQLRFSPDDLNCTDLLRKLVPDPAGTTTLGEALLVLSLARPEIKARVKAEFEVKVKVELGKLTLPSKVWPKDHPPISILPLTWHALGIWDDGTIPVQTGLTSSQLEITRALRTAYDSRKLHDALNNLYSLSTEFTWLAPQISEAETQIAVMESNGKSRLNAAPGRRLEALQAMPQRTEAEEVEKNDLVQKGIDQLPPSDRVAYKEKHLNLLKLQARQETISNNSASVAKTLRDYGIEINDLVTMPPAAAGGNSQNSYSAIRRVVLQITGLSSASPRVAAADEMLKSLIIALEDDLSRDFIQPMIKHVRERLLTQANVRVGVIQRESMLATNRGKARIDPRASAQLAVGTEQDILTGIQQLAQIYMTVQSGGALAALGALQKQPREPAPEIYALTTGNRFEVTPVFDPSGQALRFKFDFVGSTNIQEPNGSTSTQLPRIERHTVNTEVQLSNLETREISRFESTARLGRPTEYSGGLPIFKDLPGFRPWVPLVGWFVRKGGSNAVAQQSVIFGQTTMYPTIGALIDLVTDSGLQSGQTPGPPK
jgi:hypothetical protein